jgi:CRISPR-associated endonuclease Cas2
MYLIAYDVVDSKRRKKVQKVAYSYAFGGQKSALEALLLKKELKEIAKKISSKMDLETDRAHIVKVKKFIYLGVAREIKFNKGDIIV